MKRHEMNLLLILVVLGLSLTGCSTLHQAQEDRAYDLAFISCSQLVDERAATYQRPARCPVCQPSDLIVTWADQIHERVLNGGWYTGHNLNEDWRGAEDSPSFRALEREYRVGWPDDPGVIDVRPQIARIAACTPEGAKLLALIDGLSRGPGRQTWPRSPLGRAVESARLGCIDAARAWDAEHALILSVRPAQSVSGGAAGR